MLKKFLFYIIFYYIFLFLPRTIVFADSAVSTENEILEQLVIDDAEIFTDEQKDELLEASNLFYNRTGYNVVIHTIENNLVGDVEENIQSLANYNYQSFFSDSDFIYILMSEESGDMIIKYGDINSDIVTQELISVMMMSVQTDFEQGNIVDGIKSALTNGMVLIEENIKLNADTHEVLEVKDNSESNKYLIICTIAAVIFVINIIYLIFGNKKKG